MTQIRTTHPDGYMTGRWLDLAGLACLHGRACYVVIRPGELVADFWVVSDPDGRYEFREAK